MHSLNPIYPQLYYAIKRFNIISSLFLSLSGSMPMDMEHNYFPICPLRESNVVFLLLFLCLSTKGSPQDRNLRTEL
jgi:hypothetical protein